LRRLLLVVALAASLGPLELAEVMPSELAMIGVTPSRWSRTVRQYETVRSQMGVEHISDRDVLAMLIGAEIGSLSEPYYTEALGALSNQYFSRLYCYGNCETTYAQLRWLTGFQGWYARTPDRLIRGGKAFLLVAERVIAGDYKRHNGWVWGNYDYWGDSLMGDYVRGDMPTWTTQQPYLLLDESHRWVLLSRAQAWYCQRVDCLGLQQFGSEK